MMTLRKATVQKSFRIDSRYENDMALLARVVNRSQTELVNQAFKEFLQDNRQNFIRAAVLECYMNEAGIKDHIVFQLGGLTVEFYYHDDGIGLDVHGVVKDGDEIVDEYTRTFEKDTDDDLDNYLISLSEYINLDADDTQKYLDNRVGYADFISRSRMRR